MPKILKVFFSGICTYTPAIPKEAKEEIGEFFVLMPAARQPRLARQPVLEPKADKGKPQFIGRHHAYLYIPSDVLKTAQQPTMVMDDEAFGPCNVYLIDNGRVSFDRTPDNALHYFVDPDKRPVKGRPDEDNPDIAPPNDVRWIPGTPDIFENPPTLKPTVDPRKDPADRMLAMVVQLHGGLIECNHPCNTVQPRMFKPPEVDIEERVMAPELTVTMAFGDDVERIKLTVKALNPDEHLSGLSEGALDLAWPDSGMMQLRIGNDTLDEIVAIRNSGRCAPVPSLPRAEADFDLHYDLLNVDPCRHLPLPTRGGDEGDVGGCVGLFAELPEEH